MPSLVRAVPLNWLPPMVAVVVKSSQGVATLVSRFTLLIPVKLPLTEPPAKFAGRSREQLFEALDLELRKVEVLKVVNSQWLVGELRHDFDRLMVGFCARGGRVEIQT